MALEQLQAAQEVFEDWQVLRAATGLSGDVDAVSEDDLVLLIDRLLCDVTACCRVFRKLLRVVRRLQVHAAQGAGRNIDGVNMVEDHRLVCDREADVMFL